MRPRQRAWYSLGDDIRMFDQTRTSCALINKWITIDRVFIGHLITLFDLSSHYHRFDKASGLFVVTARLVCIILCNHSNSEFSKFHQKNPAGPFVSSDWLLRITRWEVVFS